MYSQHFDIVISGGGLSGCLMVLSLASLKHRNGTPLTIAIIESTAIKQSIKQTFDDRVLALAHGSASYLQQLGAWSTIKKQACAIKDIHISDRGHYGKARLSAQDYNVNALGYVVAMSVIGEALVNSIENSNNITWFTPDAISKIEFKAQQVDITLNSQQQLTAKLLLGCDGGNSICRQLANIAVSQNDYQQSALIANVACEHDHQGKAFERFTEYGPIAMLPMTNFIAPNIDSNSQGRCSLVWTLPPTQAQKMAELSDDKFAQQLEQNFGTWLGKITYVGKRNVYPLALIQAKQQTYHRMALIGNASHTIHPIAGQGFNLGLRDVKQMAELIEQALVNDESNNSDIGSLALLNQYSDLRTKDLKQVISLTDSLVTLFSNQLPPLVVGRNIGLKVLNYVNPLKNALVRKTMGY
ncbi:MAG: 2-octaprenyl-6-methoxyphenyl hydroxylase [Gammaproteobacteria bacterium]|nr:MAG: 2-octaprenyl-6-methoxyphenyl hydroxylase [Gammaproteobacteria bacterium]